MLIKNEKGKIDEADKVLLDKHASDDEKAKARKSKEESSTKLKGIGRIGIYSLGTPDYAITHLP